MAISLNEKQEKSLASTVDSGSTQLGNAKDWGSEKALGSSSIKILITISSLFLIKIPAPNKHGIPFLFITLTGFPKRNLSPINLPFMLNYVTDPNSSPALLKR